MTNFDKVRDYFCICNKPIERCENWVMSGYIEVFYYNADKGRTRVVYLSIFTFPDEDMEFDFS